MADKIDVSIILPALNEAGLIADTLRQLAAYLTQHPELGHVEVIVVAAGVDATAAIARECTTDFAHLRVIVPARPLGKGNDVRCGFEVATGAVQLFMDADLPTPVNYITPAVERLRSGSDVVIGRRNLRAIHKSRARTLLSLGSNALIRCLFLPRIGDSQCGFKGFTAAAAHDIFTDKLRISGWAFDVEVLVAARRAGCRISELSIRDWREMRQGDLRGEGLRRAALRTLRDVLVLRLRLWEQDLLARLGLLIALAAAFHAGLAWLIGARQSIWFDEAYSINLIQHPVDQVIRLTGVDVHPPLYYLTLKAWAEVFGTTDMVLRSLSILCGTAAAIVGLLLVKRLWGRRITLLATPFVVAAPFLLRYSFEIRMYALAGLIGIAATYVLIAALEARSRLRRCLLWLGYSLLVAAGVYTLYYTALIWVVHGLWYLYLFASGGLPRSWKTLYRQPLIFVDALAAALFTFWLPTFLNQLHTVQQWFWIGPVSYRTFVDIWSLILNFLSEWRLTPELSLIFMAAAIISVYIVAEAFRLATQLERRYLVLLVLYSVVPVLMLYWVSLPPHQPVLTARYDSQVVIATYLLFGVAAAMVVVRRRTVFACFAALFLLCTLASGVVNLYQIGNDQPNFRLVADYLQSHVRADEAVITPGPQEYMIFHHYLPQKQLWFYSKWPIGTDGGYAMLHDSLRRLSDTSQLSTPGTWLVYSRPDPPYIPPSHHEVYATQIGRFHVAFYEQTLLRATEINPFPWLQVTNP